MPGVGEGALYKFEILHPATASGCMKADPMARRTEVPAGDRLGGHRRRTTCGRTSEWMARRGDAPAHRAPMSVYEVHLRLLAARA